jgi:hypothetical protein
MKKATLFRKKRSSMEQTRLVLNVMTFDTNLPYSHVSMYSYVGLKALSCLDMSSAGQAVVRLAYAVYGFACPYLRSPAQPFRHSLQICNSPAVTSLNGLALMTMTYALLTG